MSQNTKISIKKSPTLSNIFLTSDSSHSLFAYPFILLIKLYQLMLSPLFSGSCRFEPSCSNYAISSFAKHGVIKGFWLSLKRLGKCHPWHPGGYDPVS